MEKSLHNEKIFSGRSGKQHVYYNQDCIEKIWAWKILLLHLSTMGVIIDSSSLFNVLLSQNFLFVPKLTFSNGYKEPMVHSTIYYGK